MRASRDWRMASREVYGSFCKKNPDINIDYTTWENIIYTANYNFRDHLLETGERVKWFRGLGEFAVKRKKVKKIVNYGEGDKIKLPIDWKKTKELGKRVYHFNYHTDGYRFAFKWFIPTARFRYSEFFVFKPYRNTSRLLKTYIDNGFGDKYLDWEAFDRNYKTLTV